MRRPPAAGGGILLEGGASLSLTNCAFERNWGRSGGAVDVAVSAAAPRKAPELLAARRTLPELGGSEQSIRRC